MWIDSTMTEKARELAKDLKVFAPHAPPLAV
jgi:hypothetical protein